MIHIQNILWTTRSLPALADAATYYKLSRKIPEATKLRGLVTPLEGFDPAELGSLVQLPFRSIITTNFDRAFFAAYAKHAGLSAQEVNIDDPTLDAAAFSEDIYVARIHGRTEVPSSMRLSTAELAELGSNASYQKFLEHVFTRRQVLYIGFSFLDPAIEAVLRTIRASSKSLHRQEHLALIPKGAPSAFVTQLEIHSIKRIEYSDELNHAELWDGIRQYQTSSKLSAINTADVRSQPFSVAKRYLATAFARTKIGRQREPLAQAIAEGIVSGVIQNAGDFGVSEDGLIGVLKEDLGLDDISAPALVAQSVSLLARSGICAIETTDAGVRYKTKHVGASAYDLAIDRLVKGVLDRYILTQRGTDSAQKRAFLFSLFSRLLLTRGWELGAAYAARRMPNDVDVSEVVDEIGAQGLKPSEVTALTSLTENLLSRPDDEESELLAELGRTAFGLELMLESPHDPAFLQRTLPEVIYFDANVIMPAITPGHPHFDLFNQTINALKEAAGTAIINVSLRVYEGFLNEVVSHKQLAKDAMAASGGEGRLWEERAVGLYGSGNVNVFVGAYFNYRETHAGISFDDFLRVAAPYNSEADLRVYVEKRGFIVVRDAAARKKQPAELLLALEKYYSSKLQASTKSAVVIRHDSAQLSIVNYELSEGVRTVFVSADRGIRFALDYEGYSNISNSMITHLGLAQLVELLIGKLPASRGLASLLWMSPVSDDTSRIRSYFMALGLKEHDAASAMGIGELVAEIAEDASMDLTRNKLRLDAERLAERAEVNRTMERYESKFFAKMNAEAEKIRNR